MLTNKSKLKEYNQKRDFRKTSEPEGKIKNGGSNLRFVIHYHEARAKHFDFRIEWGGTLLSWAVPKGPSYSTKDKRLAVKVEDHPIEYRNFEGTIPQGEYGGGTVMLWDEGSWEPIVDVEEGLKSGSLKFIVNGKRITGKWALVRMKPRENDTKENWLLLKEKDEFANTNHELELKSIRTGRTIKEIEAGTEQKLKSNPFNTANVQLATLVKEIPKGDNWLFEVKYDGYRILSFTQENKTKLITRGKQDYTQKFELIASSLSSFSKGRAMVLDGEVAVIDESGKTNFSQLQQYKPNSNLNLAYIVFDLLAFEGEDLRELPLIERKNKLEKLLKNCPSNIIYSKHAAGGGEECFKAASELELEGIIGKQADSTYLGKRSDSWVKIKCERLQEFVIGGYTRSSKKDTGVSSLLLGVFKDKKFNYVGRAGTGFTLKTSKELEEKFLKLIRTTSPFSSEIHTKTDEKIFYLKPELVANIRFAEWTKESLLRQASFKGLRTDKKASEVVKEVEKEIKDTTKKNEIIISGVKISNPQKVIYESPLIKKIEVIQYYEKVAQQMLPFVSNRILSVVRCPKGASSSCFFNKHPSSDGIGVYTKTIQNSKGEQEDYFYIKDEAGLIYQAQMGTLEFHTWNSKVDNENYPDTIVFDLDPDEGLELDNVRQGAKDLKIILDELNLKSFIKTSGGKGYHILVPLAANSDSEKVQSFSKQVVQVMTERWPDRYTSNMRKEKRKSKIFVDWIRNTKGATSVAPYSLRAREGAKVSMPIRWSELDKIAPNDIDLSLALQRLKRVDPWKDFFEIKQKVL